MVFWGAAIVFFLAKIINLHNPYRQGFWVEISSQVVNGLFTVQGVGFLPWRIMDTWNVMWIYYYCRLDQRLRRKAKLPPVGDYSDIPDPLVDSEHVQMLSDGQLVSLRRREFSPWSFDICRSFPSSLRPFRNTPQNNVLIIALVDQVRFIKSQTWYRPHETDTHRAFSLR